MSRTTRERPRWPRWPRRPASMAARWPALASALVSALAVAFVLAGCASPPASPPAPATALRDGAVATRHIAVTAHPLATAAALQMLRRGGSAVDAVVAAQMVLGLVEPQSSGLGGGAVALHWDATRRELTSLDGLAAAPARATAGLAIDLDGKALDPEETRRGGRSVGVPGALPLLEELHRRHGRLRWSELFEPAIALAEQGFALAPYLHRVLSGPNAAREHADMRALYFDADGKVLPVGHVVRNPAYARTLRRVAQLGGDGWLATGGAREIVQSAQRGPLPSLMSEADLLGYRVQPRVPLCRPLLRRTVCVMGPASFGGVAVLQALQTIELSMPPGMRWDFDDAEFVHRYVEAGRLAQADRLHWIGDPAFVEMPLDALLARGYLAQRAAMIDPARALAAPRAGEPARMAAPLQPAPAEASTTTSQISVVDAAGNAISLTTTINLNFGARLMAGGFVLNNAMSNFADAPPPGRQTANQMAPHKRPVTSMTPTIVFDERGEPILVGGSAGGGQIVDYVASSLIEMLAAGRTPRQALARGHVAIDFSGNLQLERGSDTARQADALRAKGHRVAIVELLSGLGFAQRVGGGWIGAADPRRDGVAAGD